MKNIPLSRGLFAVIDDDDYDEISQFKWFAQKTGGGRFYAARKVTRDGRRSVEYLHRRLAQPARGMVTDHINGDSLDNRRNNLRTVTPSQNLRNSRGAIGKGASFDRKTRRWFTRISWEGKRIMLGRYKSEEEAHAAIGRARALLAQGVAPESVPSRMSAQ